MMLYFEKKIDGGSFISSFTTLITSLDGCFGYHTLKKKYHKRSKKPVINVIVKCNYVHNQCIVELHT